MRQLSNKVVGVGEYLISNLLEILLVVLSLSLASDCVMSETVSFEVEVPEALAEIVEDRRSDVEVILKVPETPGSTPGEDI